MVSKPNKGCSVLVLIVIIIFGLKVFRTFMLLHAFCWCYFNCNNVLGFITEFILTNFMINGKTMAVVKGKNFHFQKTLVQMRIQFVL